MDMEYGYGGMTRPKKQVKDAHTVLLIRLSNHIQNVYLRHFSSTWSLWLPPSLQSDHCLCFPLACSGLLSDHPPLMGDFIGLPSLLRFVRKLVH